MSFRDEACCSLLERYADVAQDYTIRVILHYDLIIVSNCALVVSTTTICIP